MPSSKTVAMSFRFTPTFKRQLEAVAELEHRSNTNVLEKLLHDYCAANGIQVPGDSEVATESDLKK